MINVGRPKKRDKMNSVIKIRVNSDLRNKLIDISESKGINLSELVRDVINDACDEYYRNTYMDNKENYW